MGFTRVTAYLWNPVQPNGPVQLELLVDTGAAATSIPRHLLEQLGIVPAVRRQFRTADGHTMERDMAAVLIEVQGLRAVVPVLFAEPEDLALLGVTALEVLGFEVDPTTQTLKQVPLIQA